MRKNRTPQVLIWSVLALALVATPVMADDDDFVGSYFTLGDIDGLAITQTIKLEADGTYAAVWNISGTFLFGNSFTAEQGAWKQTGPRQVTTRSISFDYLSSADAPPDGQMLTNTVTSYVIDFDADLDGFSATFNGTGYAPNVNPLRPGNATSVFTFSGSLAGERITVDSDSDSDSDSD